MFTITEEREELSRSMRGAIQLKRMWTGLFTRTRKAEERPLHHQRLLEAPGLTMGPVECLLVCDECGLCLECFPDGRCLHDSEHKPKPGHYGIPLPRTGHRDAYDFRTRTVR